MKLQQLLSYTRRAVDTYKMIKPGDKIAIGISGGKDSLALLYALHGLRRFYPNPFEIVAITVSLGYKDFNLDEIRKLCNNLDVPYYVIDTDIADIVFDERKESKPCSLCSKMRKGAFNTKAIELGCNKIALGHHKEDLIETFMLSLFFEGRFHTFQPNTYLNRTELFNIRPLMFVPERDIIGFKNLYNLPVVINPCPVDKKTRREEMKELLHKLNQDIPGSKERMFKAILSDIVQDPEQLNYNNPNSFNDEFETDKI